MWTKTAINWNLKFSKFCSAVQATLIEGLCERNIPTGKLSVFFPWQEPKGDVVCSSKVLLKMTLRYIEIILSPVANCKCSLKVLAKNENWLELGAYILYGPENWM